MFFFNSKIYEKKNASHILKKNFLAFRFVPYFYEYPNNDESLTNLNQRKVLLANLLSRPQTPVQLVYSDNINEDEMVSDILNELSNPWKSNNEKENYKLEESILMPKKKNYQHIWRKVQMRMPIYR